MIGRSIPTAPWIGDAGADECSALRSARPWMTPEMQRSVAHLRNPDPTWKGRKEMSEHTPGPWEVICNDMSNISSYVIVRIADNLPIAGTIFATNTTDPTVTMTAEEEFANAKLIAAAPDLLEACLSILNTEGAARIGCESKAMEGLDWKYHYNKVRAAIKKSGWTG